MSSFLVPGEAYDRFMGRYSRPLAAVFSDAAGVSSGQAVLDVGCGPGALTGALVERVGADLVSAVDPSPPFVADCAARYPGATVREGSAENLPFEDAAFDHALAQLVLYFVTDPAQAGREFRRVLRPGGVAAACVWELTEGMQMLRAFWDAALTIDPEAPDEARTLSYGRPGEIADWLATAGFEDIRETDLEVSSTYASFDELWDGLLAGIGPSGSYCVGLAEKPRAALREALFERVGSPTGSFALSAVARCASGRSPA